MKARVPLSYQVPLIIRNLRPWDEPETRDLAVMDGRIPGREA
jgi:hypothetical protein